MSIKQLYNQNVVSFDVNKINILNSEEIETKLIKLINKSNCKLTLNLSNVNFIDSTGFRMLFKLKSMLDIKLINISNDLQELFTLVSY